MIELTHFYIFTVHVQPTVVHVQVFFFSCRLPGTCKLIQQSTRLLFLPVTAKIQLKSIF